MQSSECQFDHTNMFCETHQIIEDSELDGLIAVASYEVMAILAGKMFAQAGAKVMTQYGLKKGLKAFGMCGAESVQAEFCQIHMQNTFTQLKLRILH